MGFARSRHTRRHSATGIWYTDRLGGRAAARLVRRRREFCSQPHTNGGESLEIRTGISWTLLTEAYDLHEICGFKGARISFEQQPIAQLHVVLQSQPMRIAVRAFFEHFHQHSICASQPRDATGKCYSGNWRRNEEQTDRTKVLACFIDVPRCLTNMVQPSAFLEGDLSVRAIGRNQLHIDLIARQLEKLRIHGLRWIVNNSPLGFISHAEVMRNGFSEISNEYADMMHS